RPASVVVRERAVLVSRRNPGALKEALTVIRHLTITAARALAGNHFHARSETTRTPCRIAGARILNGRTLRRLIRFRTALNHSQLFTFGFFWRIHFDFSRSDYSTVWFSSGLPSLNGGVLI